MTLKIRAFRQFGWVWQTVSFRRVTGCDTCSTISIFSRSLGLGNKVVMSHVRWVVAIFLRLKV